MPASLCCPYCQGPVVSLSPSPEGKLAVVETLRQGVDDFDDSIEGFSCVACGATFYANPTQSPASLTHGCGPGWELTVESHEGDLVLVLPSEFLAASAWKAGDEVCLEILPDNALLARLKD